MNQYCEKVNFCDNTDCNSTKFERVIANVDGYVTTLFEGKDFKLSPVSMAKLLFNYEDYMKHFLERKYCTRRYMWALPNMRALRVISKYSPIVEVGAGSGLWAKLLQNMGCDLITTNTKEKRYCVDFVREKFTRIEQLSTTGAVKRYPDRNVLMIWPPLRGNMAYRVAKNMTSEYLIYIGESAGGSCANARFFETLDEKFKLVKTIDIPQWPNIHDSLFIYRRK